MLHLAEKKILYLSNFIKTYELCKRKPYRFCRSSVCKTYKVWIGFINQITNFGANAVRYGTYFLP